MSEADKQSEFGSGPIDGYLDRAFEDKFLELICEVKGHAIGPDQCGKPEHDLCYRCRRLRVEIEADQSR